VGLPFTIDRNLTRMYVILVLAALLLICLSCLAAYAVSLVKSRQRARKLQAVAARLDAVLVRAEREQRNRTAAASASDALTTVLPAIQPEDRAPRRVA